LVPLFSKDGKLNTATAANSSQRLMLAGLPTVLLLGAAVAVGSPQVRFSKLPGITAQQTFTSDAKEIELKAAARAPDGTLWTVVGTRDKGKLAGRQEILIWGFDRNANRIGDLALSDVPGFRVGQGRDAGPFSLNILDNGNLMLLSNSTGEISVAVIDWRSKRLLAKTPIENDKDLRLVTRLVMLGNGEMLAIGRVGTQGWIAHVGPAGVVLDELLLKDSDLGVVTDAARIDDKTLLLLGGGPGDGTHEAIWAAKIAPDGGTIAKTQFFGKGGRLAVDYSRRKYAVVYNKPAPKGWDVVVQAFTNTLDKQWSAVLFSGTSGLGEYDISGSQNGDFLIAGPSDHRRLMACRVGASGAIQWFYEVPDESATPHLLWNSELVARSNGYYLPFTEMVVGENHEHRFEQRQVVSVINFDSK
jgi:hypothetical protein